MKSDSHRFLVALLSFFIFNNAFAELRLWTDENGKTIEAEHVHTYEDKVVLRLQDGEEISVSLDTLSNRDRKYAVLLAPPRVEITVSAKIDRSNTGYDRGYGGGVQVQYEIVTASVSLKKTSSSPYEAPMMSEIYLIGEIAQSDEYIILDKSSSRFRFTDENKNEHTYSSDTVNLQQRQADMEFGKEYKGYLALVRDRTGEVLSIKSNKVEFEKNAEAVIGSKRDDRFDEDFNLVESEKAKRAVEPGRKSPRQRIPGRRF
jgi:hypothetical protein